MSYRPGKFILIFLLALVSVYSSVALRPRQADFRVVASETCPHEDPWYKDELGGNDTGSSFSTSLDDYGVPSGYVVIKVCVKAGTHTYKYTTNTTQGCYNISGIGTRSVQVTRDHNRDCKDISHVSIKKGQPQTSPSPSPSASPSVSPSPSPSPSPSVSPSPSPSPSPSVSPSPSPEPSDEPSPEPSYEPSPEPSYEPSPEPSVSPSPQPSNPPQASPSPSSDDGKSGRRTSLGADHLECKYDQFEAVMDVKEEGNPIKDILVRFYFNGQEIAAKTNDGGRAKVNFPIGADTTLTATVDGYPSQSMHITPPANCPHVSADPGRGGRVLGATTLAPTGSAASQIALFSLSVGLALVGWSVYGLNQIRRQK